VPGAAAAIVVIGGAGGVGSIAIQLLRAKTGLTIVASASREVSARRVLELGSHHVVDHSRPMAPQIEALALGQPAFVFSVAETCRHLPDIARFIAPQGRLALIDDPEALDIRPLKAKSVSIHWEAMFTRSLHETPDMIEQHRILREVAKLVESGRIVSTVTENFGPINAANLKRAHAAVEGGFGLGKIVLAGWDI
jgi:NADPH2:quinone reductase